MNHVPIAISWYKMLMYVFIYIHIHIIYTYIYIYIIHIYIYIYIHIYIYISLHIYIYIYISLHIYIYIFTYIYIYIYLYLYIYIYTYIYGSQVPHFQTHPNDQIRVESWRLMRRSAITSSAIRGYRYHSATDPLRNGVLMGKSSINGGCSSKPWSWLPEGNLIKLVHISD